MIVCLVHACEKHLPANLATANWKVIAVSSIRLMEKMMPSVIKSSHIAPLLSSAVMKLKKDNAYISLPTAHRIHSHVS